MQHDSSLWLISGYVYMDSDCLNIVLVLNEAVF